MSQPGALHGRVAVVTGGGTGIGRAVTLALAAEGATVYAVGRREEPLRETARQAAGHTVHTCPCDVTDRSAVDRLVAAVVDEVGRIDLLVNNAGINTSRRRLSELTPADWDRLLAVNATGVFNMIHAVLPVMRQQRQGLIVTISSIAGLRPSTLAGAAYSAAKHAATALSRVVELEEASNGIRCCVISPGEVDTPILDQRPEPVTAEHRARILQPEDVAAAVLFVAKLPPRASVPELVIKPATQPFA